MLSEVGFAADNGQPIVGLAAFSFDSVNYEARAGQHDSMIRLCLYYAVCALQTTTATSARTLSSDES